MDVENWEVGISTSYLDKATIINLDVKSISKTLTPFASVTLTLSIKDIIMPGLYNLHVGFKSNIIGTSLIIESGDFIGEIKSGAGKNSFVLISIILQGFKV